MGKNIAVLASGSGTNAENIIRYFREKGSARVALVLTNRQNAFVLERAKGLGVPCAWFAKSDWESGELVLSTLREHDIDFVVLAGFLARVPDNILHAYPNKMINIHPSLLPKFGGKGMYGDRVHEAVIASGEKESGITIHYTNEHYDEGGIICQQKCPVLPGDTPESFSDTVREVIALGAENITVHTLALKKGSRFLTEGTALPDGKAVGEMLGDAREKLEAAGYAPYYLYRQKFMSGSFENVGWTKPGYENLYNICIMEELCGILAVGAGGSTKLTAPGGVVKRLMAPKYPREYMDRIAHTCAEKDGIVRFYNSEPKGTN